jgi:hypothetical protein
MLTRLQQFFTRHMQYHNCKRIAKYLLGDTQSYQGWLLEFWDSSVALVPLSHSLIGWGHAESLWMALREHTPLG